MRSPWRHSLSWCPTSATGEGVGWRGVGGGVLEGMYAINVVHTLHADMYACVLCHATFFSWFRDCTHYMA